MNPSSGNLHPTAAYVICGGLEGLSTTPAVYHYGPDRHVLEARCTFEPETWDAVAGEAAFILVALTSIHWREAWKYGERAFRYCQHDLGHAIASLTVAGALLGWRSALLTSVSHHDLATITGIDRDEDFTEAEREESGCLLAIGPDLESRVLQGVPRQLVDGIQRGRWAGKASQLSQDHVQWTFIDEIARATENPGFVARSTESTRVRGIRLQADSRDPLRGPVDARQVILGRRSALGFDGRSTLSRSAFIDMLDLVVPGATWWNRGWWDPRVHLLLFIHRIEGLDSGVYVFGRDTEGLERLRAACGRDFQWEVVSGLDALYCLARGDGRALARRLSCDQDIAADGFFSLGMLADFDRGLMEYGASFYRNLFWETGMIGQWLYLAAEAAGVRSTGIGCFYDDPVHDVLGLRDHAFQSLYHFTVGAPVEDRRLTSEPGYRWEA